MRQIPDRPLASPGRLPSDIDGDESRVKCTCCGRSVWEPEAIVDNNKTYCRGCAGDNCGLAQGETDNLLETDE